mmetsp:Transcript_37775/g.95738  ORF Transcript_37775/g.95738 Transcript_37775/m.95738 type:complete len:93 (+) Transcript_37775:245-523(+)
MLSGRLRSPRGGEDGSQRPSRSARPSTTVLSTPARVWTARAVLRPRQPKKEAREALKERRRLAKEEKERQGTEEVDVAKTLGSDFFANADEA